MMGELDQKLVFRFFVFIIFFSEMLNLTYISVLTIYNITSFIPLGATALGEPWSPPQSVSISLYLSSSPSTALSSSLSGLLPHHPSISNEVFLFFFL